MPIPIAPILRRNLRRLVSRWRSPVNQDDAIMIDLASRRDRLRGLTEEVRDEDTIAELGDQLEGLAVEMARQPTSSLMAAHLKLRVVAEDYVAQTRDGYDLRLLHQVLEWMARETGGP